VCLAEHAAFSPRDTSEGVIFGGKLWLSNAYHNGNVLVRDLWSSEDGVAWTQVSDATPYDGYSEMAVYRGRWWAVKGSVRSSADGLEWTRVLEQTPFGARGYGELVVHNDRMWQLGSGADVWCTTDGVNWQCVCEQAPYGKRYATAVEVFGGKLWVMAGSTEQTSDPPEKGYAAMTTHNDVWCSADGAQWECVTDRAPWPRRMWSVAAVYRERLWLIGGYDNANAQNLGDVWSTRDGNTWEPLTTRDCFSPRHEVTPYVWEDSLWVVAGNAWPLMNDIWRLTLP
jgi:hypothetical protein